MEGPIDGCADVLPAVGVVEDDDDDAVQVSRIRHAQKKGIAGRGREAGFGAQAVGNIIQGDVGVDERVRDLSVARIYLRIVWKLKHLPNRVEAH